MLLHTTNAFSYCLTMESCLDMRQTPIRSFFEGTRDTSPSVALPIQLPRVERFYHEVSRLVAKTTRT